VSAVRGTPRLPAFARSDAFVAAVVAGTVALLALGATRRLGSAGLLVPLGLVLGALMVRRPVAMVAFVTSLVILCEGPTFGLLTFTSKLYENIYHDLTLVDVLVALIALSVGLDALRAARPLRVPGPLKVPLMLLAAAMVVGFVVGHAGGGSLRFVLASEHVLAYMLVVPVAVANLDLDRRQVQRLLGVVVALAMVKGLLGLAEVASGGGQTVEKGVTITYYEPLANWLIMLALLGVLAVAIAKVKLPIWVWAGMPLLLASLILSYRRSFWIAFGLSLLLVLILGLSPLGRRLLAPIAAFVVLAVLLIGSVHTQSQLPIAKRALSLQPSRIEANVEDRYRLDERANVLGEIREHPLTGLGMTIPWAATVRSLPVEHEGGREYVHFAALWYWLKLGILGLFAYVAILLAAMVLAWRVWRAGAEPYLRAFGLASLCAILGLAAIETTASFTGVDTRFTLLFGVQLGLLALLDRTAAGGGG
jgi:O-antigen ligase